MSVGAVSDWHDRVVLAEEAVSVVRPGDKVFVGSACATPRSLVGALERLDRPGLILVYFLTESVGTGDPPRTRYRHRVFYVGRDVRALAESDWVQYLPLSLADVPKLFRNPVSRIARFVAVETPVVEYLRSYRRPAARDPAASSRLAGSRCL